MKTFTKEFWDALRVLHPDAVNAVFNHIDTLRNDSDWKLILAPDLVLHDLPDNVQGAVFSDFICFKAKKPNKLFYRKEDMIFFIQAADLVELGNRAGR